MRAHVLIRSLVILGALLGVTAGAFAQNPAQALRPDDHIMGSDTAEMVMIEYGSFACPHCATFQTEIWPMLEAEFIETGRVQFAFRPMLTAPAQIAGAGIILAECAADDRYFNATDLLFHEQQTIFETGQAGGDVLAVYNRIGAAVGVSPEAFMACLNDPAMSDLVGHLAQQAVTDGVQGTPSFIVRGKVLMVSHLADGHFFTWGGEPLIIDGERISSRLSEDSFRRIVLHFLAMPESGH
jgi:protein-disulfide isomerase